MTKKRIIIGLVLIVVLAITAYGIKYVNDKPINKYIMTLGEGNTIENNMVYVEGTTIEVQRDYRYHGEYVVDTIKIDDFYIGKYEVTTGEWDEIMYGYTKPYKGDNYPITNVDYQKIQEFIRVLNRRTGENFRLPTETEWDYAASGGKKSKGYGLAGSNNYDEVAWLYENSGDKPHTVGEKKPNELGLYDMNGNVWEYTYLDKNKMFPKHVIKGGAYYMKALYTNISERYEFYEDKPDSVTGFRLARSIKKNK